ncbi:MAG: ABC-three component system protein [bacterium]
MAHIEGEKPGSARYNPDMTERERSSYSNRIVLCRNHHKIVDDQPQEYSVQRLKEMKNKHEEWIEDSTEKEILNITFAELSIVTKYLISDQSEPPDRYDIIPPKDKIKKNMLSSRIERSIVSGMTQVKQVADFINKVPDIEFSDRLKAGFVNEYNKLKNIDGFMGDDLFDALVGFASGESSDFKQKAAGLAVLVYLFEKCEVFEQ